MSDESIQAPAEELVICFICGEEFRGTDSYTFQNHPFCLSCYKEEIFTCDWCHRQVRQEERREVSHGYVCERCAEEEAFTCEDCGKLYANDDVVEINGVLYCSICAEEHEPCFSKFTGEREIVGAGRGIGVEIEVSKQHPVRHLQIKADGVWTAVEDASVPDGVEYTSPILHESNYEEVIKRFCKERLLEAEVDQQCGLHIHLDCADLGWCELASVFRYCRRYESWFLSVVPVSRRNNQYCRRLPNLPMPRTKADMLTYLYGQSCVRKMKLSKYPDVKGDGRIDRYFWLNVHSYFYRRTIEVRLHSGTVNAEKIVNWIKLFLRVLENARGPQKNWRHPDSLLKGMLRAYYRQRKLDINK